MRGPAPSLPGARLVAEVTRYIMCVDLLIKWGSRVRTAQAWGQDMSFGGHYPPHPPLRQGAGDSGSSQV